MEAWLETIQPIRIPRPKLMAVSATTTVLPSVSRLNGVGMDVTSKGPTIIKNSVGSSGLSSSNDLGKRSPL